MRRRAALLGLGLAWPCLLAAQSAVRDTTGDPYRWLEDGTGDRAMAWVRAENAKTVAVLEADPRYASIHRAALSMAQATDRLPGVTFIGGQLYNFWQDSAHVRGIWRRTTVASYRTAAPAWTTVLDLDALAARDGANWVWQGATCLQPAERRCLLSLSDGGEDAVTVREFDVVSRAFVPGGFSLPKGKQNAGWLAADTLLVVREWQPGDVTASGYPYIAKTVARGRALGDAREVFRGTKQDVMVVPLTWRDATGHTLRALVRGVTFFESELHFLRGDTTVRAALPRQMNIVDGVDGQLVMQLSEDWQVAATRFKGGSLVSFDLAAAVRTPDAIRPTLVFEPDARQSVGGTMTTRHTLMVGITENVTGRVLAFTRSATGAWTSRTVPLPANVSTNLLSADAASEQVLLGVTGYLTPSSIWMASATRAMATRVKELAPRFDASTSVVEQFEATSRDGTKVPYFVVHQKAMPLDGSNATILTAYGGFEVSITPRYDPNAGKLWVEQGGVYVVANIRGGGEFGPAWHQAGLKTKRQVIYDDFAAVAQDLIARRITSPRKLGIEGGSNGGLLMGVSMTQHPELFGAVNIAVPLLDMMRYEQIAAGASWVAEYGSVSVPEERAFLASISPLQNLKPGVAYPEPLIWTTTKDDRVGPQHARKFAARMADLGQPYFFYEVIEGGHGSGANIEQRAHTTALEYTYFARRLMGAPAPSVP